MKRGAGYPWGKENNMRQDGKEGVSVLLGEENKSRVVGCDM